MAICGLHLRINRFFMTVTLQEEIDMETT